jgi:hypothetical protein
VHLHQLHLLLQMLLLLGETPGLWHLHRPLMGLSHSREAPAPGWPRAAADAQPPPRSPRLRRCWATPLTGAIHSPTASTHKEETYRSGVGVAGRGA